ncbi:MFS transporter [Microbacterium terricola]|uniref:MFS transporter n=1 Tax=Microbacterium terricola TaxID=344163 RepID=A0ABM8E245_9MICO|nr:MFS transporter [Microbacterium terricola]UYK40261.1 MFS transporter [Microbacterium terricola]BDV32027.1 MFS transporter [Microbacterium terricola]
MTSESLVEPAAPITENTFVATAAGNDDPPPPIKGLRRLFGWVIPANLAIFIVWGAVPGILLPAQITALFGEGNKVANLAIVATIGAFAAMLAQPIAGQISDRTRTRWGRRAPWMVIGALTGALSLVGLAFADSLIGVVIAWTLVQITYNFAQGPLSAVMPDRVPLARRGTFAALSGIGLMVGALGGSIVGALFYNSIAAGYLTFAVISVVGLSLFVIFNPDYPSTRLVLEPFKLGDFLRTFWVNPIKHPDFFWAFTGRLLLYTGYFAVTGYQLFLLTDYFGVEHPETVIPLLGLMSLVGIIISTVVAGPLSDRIGRRKPFIFASAAVVSLAFLLPWFWQDLTAWILMTIIAGFGFGMFQAVDTALMSEVLPSAKSFAKDLGVVNIAATLPQTLAPGVAGVIVLIFGYAGLFPVAIVLGLLGALAVWPIRSTR